MVFLLQKFLNTHFADKLSWSLAASHDTLIGQNLTGSVVPSIKLAAQTTFSVKLTNLVERKRPDGKTPNAILNIAKVLAFATHALFTMI